MEMRQAPEGRTICLCLSAVACGHFSVSPNLLRAVPSFFDIYSKNEIVRNKKEGNDLMHGIPALIGHTGFLLKISFKAKVSQFENAQQI